MMYAKFIQNKTKLYDLNILGNTRVIVRIDGCGYQSIEKIEEKSGRLRNLTKTNFF
jgi:tRNA(His) 5'-end guanylyltransferase